MARAKWNLLLLAAALGLLGACGSSPRASAQGTTHSSTSSTTTSSTGSASTTAPARAVTSTLPTAAPNPLGLAQNACRDFQSFAGILVGLPEDGADAAG